MRRSITRTLITTIAATAVAAVSVAAPAHADPPLLNGTYTGDGGAEEFLWTISSACGTTGCTANIVSNQGWTSVATLTHGRYRFTVTKPDGAICSDGSFAPAYISLSIDPVTLDGTISTDSNYDCPGGHLNQEPFKLRKIG